MNQQTRITIKYLNKLTEDDKQKVIVLTTTMNPNWKNMLVSVDAITSASKMNYIDSISLEISKKIKKMLSQNKNP